MRNIFLLTISIFFILDYCQLNAQSVEEHLSRIIVWRTGEFNHPNLRNRVVLNEVEIANLTRKNYIQLIVPPGKYVLEVGDIEFVTKDNNEVGKWHHPDEGGVMELEVKGGMVYNIQGIMHRTDPDANADSVITEEKLRYYIELKRYRGSYGHLQRELQARKINLNRAYLYSRVVITTTFDKKIKACLISNTQSEIEFVELETLVFQTQTMPKSKVRSISLIN